IYSLTMARPLDRAVPLGPENKLYRGVPSWHEMLNLPTEQRRAHLRDAAARAKMRNAVENPNTDPAAGTTLRPPSWDMRDVDRVALAKNKTLEGRTIKDIANAQSKAPADAFLDLALDEDFATEIRWRMESPEWKTAVQTALMNPHIVAGTSD